MGQDAGRGPLCSLAQELRQRGVRLTEQRRQLLSIIEGADEPIRAETLLALGKARMADLNRATVYRTISLLKRHGLVDELDLLHHEARGHYYEPVPAEQELHIVCLQCGHVIETRSRYWEALVREVSEDFGFNVSVARIEVGGICRSCQSAESS